MREEGANRMAISGEIIHGQCEACGNVALLSAAGWCDRCSEDRDDGCEIAERLRAALASTALSLSAREREILMVRIRSTARRTARRCRIGLGVMNCLEMRVLKTAAN